MHKVRSFEEHAADCRFLALGLKGEQRTAMERMAETWEQLAKDREEWLRKHPEMEEPEPDAVTLPKP